MMKTWVMWVVVSTFAAVTGCRAPSPNWNGTWKLDASKGNFQGSIFTISVAPDGEYRFDDERTPFTFRCDGKDRPSGDDRTLSCIRRSATGLDLVRKEHGVKHSVSHWELSTDGKVLTATLTSFPPSGPVTAAPFVLSRVSGSNDFAGEWQDATFLQKHAEMTLKIDGHALHIGNPGAGLYIDAPLDGGDAPEHAPGIPQGMTYAVRIAGNREILTVEKFHGKVFTQGSLELSRDGKSLTDSWWRPEQPIDKGRLVYERK
jgi:hypothetical protein